MCSKNLLFLSLKKKKRSILDQSKCTHYLRANLYKMNISVFSVKKNQYIQIKIHYKDECIFIFVKRVVLICFSYFLGKYFQILFLSRTLFFSFLVTEFKYLFKINYYVIFLSINLTE